MQRPLCCAPAARVLNSGMQPLRQQGCQHAHAGKSGPGPDSSLATTKTDAVAALLAPLSFLPTNQAFAKIASVVATLSEEQVKVGAPGATGQVSLTHQQVLLEGQRGTLSPHISKGHLDCT